MKVITIKFRAWDGERWWVEGEMNGFEYYRTEMFKMGSNWRFSTDGTKTVASSEVKGHRLQYTTSRAFQGEWVDA